MCIFIQSKLISSQENPSTKDHYYSHSFLSHSFTPTYNRTIFSLQLQLRDGRAGGRTDGRTDGRPRERLMSPRMRKDKLNLSKQFRTESIEKD